MEKYSKYEINSHIYQAFDILWPDYQFTYLKEV
jgi:hypothetical protein